MDRSINSEPRARLRISQAWGARRGSLRGGTLNEIEGGREVLLGFLETQIGLPVKRVSKAEKVAAFAERLSQSGAEQAVFGTSFGLDPWITTDSLIRRWEELRLAGWEGHASDQMPQLANDLAAAIGKDPMPWADETERLRRVEKALAQGQSLPLHRCELLEAADAWPQAWQPILTQLTVVPPRPTGPAAPEGSLLRCIQDDLNGFVPPATLSSESDSFKWVSAASVAMACESIATMSATRGKPCDDTVIVCEDTAVAARLDGALARRGLPTFGARTSIRHHPAMQILPLALQLCWNPIDPKRLVTFLSLPVHPVPARARWRLIAALQEQPGHHSRAWDGVMESLLAEEGEKAERLAERLNLWLSDLGFVRWGEPLLPEKAVEICQAFARWAAGYSAALRKRDEDEDNTPSAKLMILALTQAAEVAGDLIRLLQQSPETITPARLDRLLQIACEDSAENQEQAEMARAPWLVSSLKDVPDSMEHLIWLGTGTDRRATCHWTAAELQGLSRGGLAVDDGSRQTQILREAERQGLSRVRRSLLVVTLPEDLERQTHPLWLQAEGALREALRESPQPMLLDDTLGAGGVSDVALGRWTLPTTMHQSSPPIGERSIWQIVPGLLRSRPSASASSLETQLGCPLKWVLQYMARLRPGSTAELPDGVRLKGNFCHQLLKEVLSDTGSLSPEEGAARIRARFDERVTCDAVSLAHPAQALEKEKLRTEITRATKNLLTVLNGAGGQIVELEMPIDAKADGRSLTGAIDCLVSMPDETEAIVDFKYGGRSRYRGLLQDGRAIQLATYARSRCSESKNTSFPSVAYLVLSEGFLYTAPGSALNVSGATPVPGTRDIEDVWREFDRAIRVADTWIRGKAPVTAYPLRDRDDWPPGADLVLEKTSGKNPHRICRYCDYGAICGRKGVR